MKTSPSRSIVTGIKMVFGCPSDVKTIDNAPEGRRRLILRENELAKLVVRTKDAIRVMLLEDLGYCWLARPELYVTGKISRLKRRAHLPGADIRAFKTFQFV